MQLKARMPESFDIHSGGHLKKKKKKNIFGVGYTKQVRLFLFILFKLETNTITLCTTNYFTFHPTFQAVQITDLRITPAVVKLIV